MPDLLRGRQLLVGPLPPTCSQEEDEPESLSPHRAFKSLFVSLQIAATLALPPEDISARALLRASPAFVVHGLRTLGYHTLCASTVRMCTPTGSSDGDTFGTTHGNRSRRR